MIAGPTPVLCGDDDIASFRSLFFMVSPHSILCRSFKAFHCRQDA